MAVTSSTLALGTPLPSFTLTDVVSGAPFSSSTLLGKPSVVAILCNHCPYVKHIRVGLSELGKFCDEHGVRMIGISSNDIVSHPEDGPAEMKKVAAASGWPFPYLFDESQNVARAFQAACTPEFYVFDANGKLAYRGQMDDSRPSNGKPVTGVDVRNAIEALLAGSAPNADQKASIGCSIKWKAAR